MDILQFETPAALMLVQVVPGQPELAGASVLKTTLRKSGGQLIPVAFLLGKGPPILLANGEAKLPAAKHETARRRERCIAIKILKRLIGAYSRAGVDAI